MKMKKLVSLGMAMVLSLGLVACGGGEKESSEAADKVDMVISGMSPSPERKENVDFSDVYYTGKNVLIVREGEEDKITSEDQVKSMKVAAQKGSIQETYAKKIGCTGLKSLESVPDLMMELKNGNVDAVIVNDTVGLINVIR